jgi:hypothetical protein
MLMAGQMILKRLSSVIAYPIFDYYRREKEDVLQSDVIKVFCRLYFMGGNP